MLHSSSPGDCDEESSGRFGRVSSLGSHSRVASWAEEAVCMDKLCRFEVMAGVLLSRGPLELETCSFGLGEERMTDTCRFWEGDGKQGKGRITFSLQGAEDNDDKSVPKPCWDQALLATSHLI